MPALLTRVVWLLWVGSLGALAVQFRNGTMELGSVAAVDGLTVVMWVTVAFFSGIVHSYSRRYMAGDPAIDRFFGRVFAFTLVVMVLVAAESLLLFAVAWLAMGLALADLIGHVEGWPQAAAALAAPSLQLLADDAVGVPDELGLVSGRDGRAGGDVVAAAVAARRPRGLPHHDREVQIGRAHV